jgi:hypothetical protein
MEKCKKFNREDVTDEMLAPVLDARARNTDSDMKRHIHVEHVVILPRGKKEGAVQPTKIEPWDFEVSNLAGATFHPRPSNSRSYALPRGTSHRSR